MNKNKPIDMLFITYFLAASIKKKKKERDSKNVGTPETRAISVFEAHCGISNSSSSLQ